MSAGEGLDEAAKDAADIAAFFKSGESLLNRKKKKERQKKGRVCPKDELSVWYLVNVPHRWGDDAQRAACRRDALLSFTSVFCSLFHSQHLQPFVAFADFLLHPHP